MSLPTSVETGIVNPTVSVGPMGAMPLNPMVAPNLVRRYPENYFWAHRRWKSSPPAERVAGEAG